nr:unnamed protein product [Spirometra erinaceieuropaei]
MLCSVWCQPFSAGTTERHRQHYCVLLFPPTNPPMKGNSQRTALHTHAPFLNRVGGSPDSQGTQSADAIGCSQESQYATAMETDLAPEEEYVRGSTFKRRGCYGRRKRCGVTA